MNSVIKKTVCVPINRAGWPFIALFAILTTGLWVLHQPLGWVGVVLTAWCAYFFRDPERVTPGESGLVISPADGMVLLFEDAPPPLELGMGDGVRPRVSIFMNVFNVHVNRIPAHGVIEKISYRPGRFFNASLDKASEHNERMSVSMKTNQGAEIAFVQIAGLVARRIKCGLAEGQQVRAGDRFGLIRFGSRVDVYLPAGTRPKALPGQTAVAGETVIADLGK
ncbi:MAG: phosphatidylserine decarboxylase [Alphaproteobacteria bacterium]|nr:phosphatidylserine decarboxylase [Alphaproteobacteria bacterium]MDP7543222.1 phosphatidylserine decarboxylase [Alphaproteobacteria bacterium]MDP7669657.1 phosphatidylserine decarboxylase [Alphaproteobacteria bacterium]MEE1562446.1 phosphatidylserine decarboxylase [Alphaproteobacteria bacterium]MEE1568918.1 phosphatidylserine decarboxylase [Alphaproteobacteria bacterium]